MRSRQFFAISTTEAAGIKKKKTKKQKKRRETLEYGQMLTTKRLRSEAVRGEMSQT